MARPRTLAFTAAALIGFASNSLLCRRALGTQAIDPASFTLVRLASGALVLALIVRWPGREAVRERAGGWKGALALFAYAIAFSFAYVRLGAGVGALILFGVVQATMIAAGLRAKERMRAEQWLGFALALAGLVMLMWPRISAPDALGAGAMALAGVAWGLYSLLGRRCAHPLRATADNFAFSLPFAALASLSAAPQFHLSAPGIALAVASGALASGLGYSFWYAALPELQATRAAIVQLCVPVLTALGSVALLGEALTRQTCVAGAVILGGVALAVLRR